MMIEQKIRKLLTDSGLLPQNVDAVMDVYKKGHPEIEDKVWRQPENAYPPQFLAIVWLGVKAAALEWIDANCPEAWYRPMFTNEEIPNG